MSNCSPEGANDPREASIALSKIAKSLGVPVVALYDPAIMPADLAGAAELISLYLKLESAEARAEVLAAARAVALMAEAVPKLSFLPAG